MYIDKKHVIVRNRNAETGQRITVVENVSSVCLKVSYRDLEVSVAFDDSCGGLSILGRVDIRVYQKDKNGDYNIDVTEFIKHKRDTGIYPLTLSDFSWVQRRIDRAFRLGLLK